MYPKTPKVANYLNKAMQKYKTYNILAILLLYTFVLMGCEEKNPIDDRYANVYVDFGYEQAPQPFDFVWHWDELHEVTPNNVYGNLAPSWSMIIFDGSVNIKNYKALKDDRLPKLNPHVH